MQCFNYFRDSKNLKSIHPKITDLKNEWISIWNKKIHYMTFISVVSCFWFPHNVASANELATSSVEKMERQQSLASSSTASETLTGLVSVSYFMPTTPTNGFDSITFPMQISETLESKGFYYAIRYHLMDKRSRGQIGLQPQGDGTSLAILSISENNKENPASKNNINFSKLVKFIPGQKYNLIIERTSPDSNVWGGYVENPVTRQRDEIGTWEQRGSRGLTNSGIGFVEYRLPSINSCSQIPKTEVYFGRPQGDSEIMGEMKKVRNYGKCESEIHFKMDSEKTGVTLKN